MWTWFKNLFKKSHLTTDWGKMKLGEVKIIKFDDTFNNNFNDTKEMLKPVSIINKNESIDVTERLLLTITNTNESCKAAMDNLAQAFFDVSMAKELRKSIEKEYYKNELSPHQKKIARIKCKVLTERTVKENRRKIIKAAVGKKELVK